jgi:aconitate hydratase
MGGGEYYLTMPKIVKVNLTGKLRPGTASKDIVLEVLRQYTVKGGVSKIFEYCGNGVKTLSVPERATITNMGAELGATTSIFPSDENTYKFLKAQNRENDFVEISADADAVYDEEIEINLNNLEPLIACPHSPDNVVPVSNLKGVKVSQVAIGSCTNSSFVDLMKAAKILEGKTVSENVSLVIAPGSKQVLNMLAENGVLAKLVASGARILECACGPCIGMGQAPRTDGVSIRTFNRNFEGRSGTKSALVYLASPEIAALSAVKGYIDYDESYFSDLKVELPEKFVINDNLIVSPAEASEDVEVVRGPNIKPFPKAKPVEAEIKANVLFKLVDNITTDNIMPSNAKLLP